MRASPCILIPESNPIGTPEVTLGTVELCKRRWRIIESEPAGTRTGIGYTCVSYYWGKTRQPHLLSPTHEMSARAVRAAESVIERVQPPALWLDALCVPLEGKARSSCLRQLGAIYAGAAQVVVVLSEACGDLLDQIHRTRAVDEAGLRLFEADEWVTRVWTYQEVVNSKKLCFIADGRKEKPVDGQEFLNHVGHALMQYKNARAKTAFDLHLEFPRTDSLENLMADWLMADYLQRSAYQILSSMHGRVAERPSDFFDAAVGAVTGAAADAEHPEQPAAEAFLRACEQKGDFSFVYTTAPRSAPPGRCWRPAAGPLVALFPWHTYGAGQQGKIHEHHLTLEGMWQVPLGAMDAESQAALAALWRSPGTDVPGSAPGPATLLDSLRRAGFSGTGGAIELQQGYFFPGPIVDDLTGVFAAVSTGVQWTRGALGLLLRARPNAAAEFVAVGLFAGAVPKQGVPIDVAHEQLDPVAARLPPC